MLRPGQVLGGALLVLLLTGGATLAQEHAPITAVTESSPAKVEFSCTGVPMPVVMDLQVDTADAFYIQETGPDVAIPITCANAPIWSSSRLVKISCTSSLRGMSGMNSFDGIDLENALAGAVGATVCRRTR